MVRKKAKGSQTTKVSRTGEDQEVFVWLNDGRGLKDATPIVWAGVQARWFCRPAAEEHDSETGAAIITPLQWLVEVNLPNYEIERALAHLQQDGLLRYKIIHTDKAYRVFVRITDVQMDDDVAAALDVFEEWHAYGVTSGILESLGSHDLGLSHFDAALAAVCEV